MSARRNPVWVFAAIAAAVLATVGTVAAIESNDGGAPSQHAAGRPTESTKSEPTKSQSPDTWVDSRVIPVTKHGHFGQGDRGWIVPDPLKRARRAWFAAVAEHLDPSGEHLKPDPYGATWPLPAPDWNEVWVDFGILIDDGVGPFHRCLLFTTSVSASGCRREPFRGPHGEDAWVIRSRHDDEFCDVWVAVERADGTLGYVYALWEGEADANPLPLKAMAGAAADPRLTLPADAFKVPPNSAVAAVVRDHFEGFSPDDWGASQLGFGETGGAFQNTDLGVGVQPAGRPPWCNRVGVLSCVARQVYGADDPTTVYVGLWHTDFGVVWRFVYVGPRNSVEVSCADCGGGPLLQKRLIDLLLDPRLQ